MCAYPLTVQFKAPPKPQPFQGYPRAGGGASIQSPPGTHPVALVAILSIMLGGWVGMLINRQIAKGLIFGIVLGFVPAAVTCGLSLVVWYPLTVIDAILVANRINRGEAVSDWQFF